MRCNIGVSTIDKWTARPATTAPRFRARRYVLRNWRKSETQRPQPDNAQDPNPCPHRSSYHGDILVEDCPEDALISILSVF